MKYRRILVPGGTYFFTVITFERRKIFIQENEVEKLRQAFRTVQERHPFKIEAAVILPDHLHMIWRLPEGDSDYPNRWRLIKSHFTRHWGGGGEIPVSATRLEKGEQAVWQRRYWEHLIRDEEDLKRHVEYIHYNPVKHGLVQAPVEWEYSSFHTYVREGLYAADWGAEEGIEVTLNERME